MRSNGHANLVTRPCGFIVHPSMGWLGASPDAVVTDPSVELQHGIAEFKCPYTKKDIPPDEACTDTNFYCTVIDNRLHLKHSHTCYHQVQLQLFVSMDMYPWCDFCIYTLKGVSVERFWLDVDWCNRYIPELESFFDAFMLPEILYPNTNHLTSYKNTSPSVHCIVYSTCTSNDKIMNIMGVKNW